MTEPEAPLHCSFCNKSQDDVRHLIAGDSAAICDECVDACVDVLIGNGIAPRYFSRWWRRFWGPFGRVTRGVQP